VHDDVGAHAAVLALRDDLGGEVAVFDHARELHDPLQLQLAPASAHLRRPQGVDQLFGLVLQPIRAGAHRRDLLAQPRVGRLPLLLDGAQLPLHPLQRGRHRVQQLPDRLRAGSHVTVGLRRERRRRLLDPPLGERDELLVVAGERVGRQRLERLLQLGVPAGEQGLPLHARLPLAAQRGRRGRRLRLGLPQPLDRAIVRRAQLLEPRHEACPLGTQPRRVGSQHRGGVGRRLRRLGRREPGPGRHEEPHGPGAQRGTDDHAYEQHGSGRGVHPISVTAGIAHPQEARRGLGSAGVPDRRTVERMVEHTETPTRVQPSSLRLAEGVVPAPPRVAA
jgi:hypothetical protein